MAADTREDAASKPPESSKPTTSPSRGTAHEPHAVPVAPPNANVFAASASLNTAGGRVKEATYIDALRSIKASDFQEIHTKPCARESILTGIGGGFGIGGVRAILGGTLTSSPLARYGADQYSLGVEHLQLGGWVIRVRLVTNVQLLPNYAT